MRLGLVTVLLAVAACNKDDPEGKDPAEPGCVGEDCGQVDDDADDDGFDKDQDCDDTDPEVHPDATEVPYDGIDQDCAGGDLVDVDDDGFDAVEAGGTDCADDDPARHPTADDTVGDGVDQDCDGLDGRDGDQDGHASRQSGGDDCDDSDAARNPGATEVWYDGVDQDCDRACDYDQDGDGAVEPGSPAALPPVCGAAPDDCDDTDPTASTVAVLSTDPIAGENNVSPAVLVTVTLTEPDPTATLVLSDAAGVAVPGTTTPSGSDLVFVPDVPLAWSTTYTVEVTHGCGTDSYDFTVLAEPLPLDPLTLVGRVWELDLAGGTWVEPAGVGPLLAPQLTTPILLSVTAATATTLDMRVGFGDTTGSQDVCVETTDVSGIDFTANPVLGLGPVDLAMDVSGIALTVDDAFATGQFTGDGGALLDLVLDGAIDTRPLVPLIGGGAPDAVCVLVAAFGVSCVPCPDGSGTYCLEMRVEDIDSPELVGGTLVQRTTADIAADPTCP